MQGETKDPAVKRHVVEVPSSMGGARLDVTVAALVPGVSRSAAQRLVKASLVTVDGRNRPQGFRVRPGSVLEVVVPPPQAGDTGARVQAPELDVLYEDDFLVAVNKRHGVVVHPGAGHGSGTLADALLASGRKMSVVGGEDRAGLVHRLDRDTSGVVIAAKDEASHAALASQFKARTAAKAYLALVLGPRTPDEHTISTAFGRRAGDRKLFTGRVREGREAVTSFKTLGRGSLCALLLVRPRTGRTHQIRVHLAESGHPVVGDRVYGRAYPRPGSTPKREAEALALIKRQALHAWALRVKHPATGEPLVLKAPLPRDMEAVLDAVFGPGWRDLLPREPFS